MLSGEAALFQTGGLGGLTIVPPKKRPQEARPESTTSLRSDFAELGLGSEHPINSTLRFGNCVCFRLRPRLRRVAMQNWEVGRFRSYGDKPDARLALHADDVPAIS